MLNGMRTVCTQVESHPVTQGDQFCDQCGAATKQVADGATQLAAHTTETKILRFKCGRCSTQVAPGATKCPNPDCKARLGRDVDIIDWGQESLKDKGLWPVVAAPVSIPVGGQPVVQPNKRRWLVPTVLLLLLLAVIGSLAYGFSQANRAARAEQALRDLPQQAAIILPPATSPTTAPTAAIPTPTTAPTNQAQATALPAAAPTEQASPTALPPTAIPDDRPTIAYDAELRKGTPSGEKLADLFVGDKYTPYYWMDVGGVYHMYIASDKGTGWVDSYALDIDPMAWPELLLVQGVKAEYENRGFVTMYQGKPIAFIRADGSYNQRVALPNKAGEFVALTNGDFIRVERREGSTVFFTTVTNIIDGPSGVNIAGALPEWVATDSGVPPAPTAIPVATGGGQQSNPYVAYRYNYTPSVNDSANGQSAISYKIVRPAGFTSIDTNAVTVVIGGDGGDAVDFKAQGKTTILVGNGTYRVRLVQYKNGGYATISEQWVEVKDGHTLTVTFTGGSTVVR